METTVAAETPNAIEGLSKPIFTCFPKLAIELRLEIFKHAMPGPRRVRLIIKDHGGQNPFLVSDAAVPPLLHVCKESRQEFLKHYEQLLPLSNDHHPIYFSFSLDELYFGPQDNQESKKCYFGECSGQCGLPEIMSYMQVAEEQTLARVKRLAIGTCMFESSLNLNYCYDYFQGLRQLAVVYENPDCGATSYASLYHFEARMERCWKLGFDPEFLIAVVKMQYMDGSSPANDAQSE